MFPAQAGMNRVALNFKTFLSYVPRAGGDEPIIRPDIPVAG